MATAKATNKAKTITTKAKSTAPKTVDNVVLDAGDVEKKTEVFNDNLAVNTDVTEAEKVDVVNPVTHTVVRKPNWIHRHI